MIDLVGVSNARRAPIAEGGWNSSSRRCARASSRSEPDLVTRVVFELADGTHYKVTRTGDRDRSRASHGRPEVMGASMGGDAPAAATELRRAGDRRAGARARDGFGPRGDDAPAQPARTRPSRSRRPRMPRRARTATGGRRVAGAPRSAAEDEPASSWPAPAKTRLRPQSDEIVLAQNTDARCRTR